MRAQAAAEFHKHSAQAVAIVSLRVLFFFYERTARKTAVTFRTRMVGLVGSSARLA
jgi:hypothetical protein